MARDSLVFSEFTDFAVDVWLIAAGANAQIGGAIGAHDDLGTETAQAGKTDSTQHAGSESCDVGGIDILHSFFKILVGLLDWL